MSELRKILQTLGDLGEADATALAICSGVDRDLALACLDQMVRAGKVRRVVVGAGGGTASASGSTGGEKRCAAGCCNVAETNRDTPVELYSLVSRLSPSLHLKVWNTTQQ